MRLRSFLPVVLAFGLHASAFAADFDSYGGWRKLEGKKTGYFHTEKIDGRWWLVTPDGNAFFSKGVDHVAYESEAPTHPQAKDVKAWAKKATKQLRSWNFNTLGSWSSPETYGHGLAYTPILDMAAAVQSDVWLKGGVIDYFSPTFRETADRVAQRACKPLANDPWLLGYFTDNELRWGKDWRAKTSLLEEYLAMPSDSPGAAKATEFLKSRGHAASDATDEDKSEFAGVLAAEYARVTSEAIRRYDPNHMVLGCRFAYYPGDPVVRGVGPYFEVVSFHTYDHTPPLDSMRKIAEISGKPTMVTEFSFKAMDSGLPNTRGAAEPVATQQDRADGFASFVRALAELPGCVGYHWFQYRDQPKEGRKLDGENSNYGVVRGDFTPWNLLTSRMCEVNTHIEAWHAEAAAGK